MRASGGYLPLEMLRSDPHYRVGYFSGRFGRGESRQSRVGRGLIWRVFECLEFTHLRGNFAFAGLDLLPVCVGAFDGSWGRAREPRVAG